MHDRFTVGATASLHFGWLARDERLVCVKRMHPFHVVSGRAVDVVHPNVVAMLGTIRRRGELLATMEYVPGASLAEILQASRGGLEARVAVAIVAGMLRGLHAVHEARVGLIARGLSPSSVIVGEDGRARLIDLDVYGPETAAEVIEKLPYAAPELIAKRQEDGDVRPDVWAAGVVLWEALTGASLFKAPTVEATLHAIQWKRIPEVHPVVDAILARALARDPYERFTSAQAMVFELERTSCASPDEVARALIALDLRCISGRRALADAVTRRERSDLHIKCSEGVPKE